MRIMSIEEIKEIELDLLRNLNEICEKNSINLYLTYGTLLGAVRHGGFIPWDDDIDVMVLREDYDKLVKVLQSTPSPYRFRCMENDSKYSFPLAKFYDDRTVVEEKYGRLVTGEFGVYVDIFILDNLPDSVDVSEKFFKEAQRHKLYYALSNSTYRFTKNVLFTIPRNLIAFLFRLRGYRYYLEKYINYWMKHNNSDTECVGVVQFGEGLDSKERCSRKALTGDTVLQFEGIMCKVPDNYVQYLTQMYGDYMSLPPVEERVTKHKHDVYWK